MAPLLDTMPPWSLSTLSLTRVRREAGLSDYRERGSKQLSLFARTHATLSTLPTAALPALLDHLADALLDRLSVGLLLLGAFSKNGVDEWVDVPGNGRTAV